MFEGIVKVKLLRPIKVPVPDGYKDLTELELDFNKVTAAVIIKCEQETVARGNLSTIMRGLSSEYCGRMAALISGVDFSEIVKLDAESFDRVWQTVGAFINKQNPQEFYNQFVGNDDVAEPTQIEESTKKVFTKPAEVPVDG